MTRRGWLLLWLTVTAIALADGGLLLEPSMILVAMEGRSASVPAGLTVDQALRRLAVPPLAGDLLAVDHTMLRSGAYPPRVLVNGQPASGTRRLHRGDRVTVQAGRDRLEPVVRTLQQLAAVRPGNPVRSLASGPAQAILDRGRLSGRVIPVAFHPAGGSPTAPLPVALTFDDGPWPHTTAQILAILAQRRAPATFFVVGRQVERYPQLLRRELAVAMAVGTHSYSHPQPFDRLPAPRVRQEIIRGRRTLDPLGVRPVGFRPPGGTLSVTVVAAAEQLGFRTVLWTVDPADWQPGITADQLVRRVLAAARPGAIVLLHDGGGNRSATVAALPAIIDGLRHLGLTLTTLPT
ncbi:MAG TPA: polysaccharide deacetylase family protein [Actinomycetes bacterium]|nr:polysaccharide deacetylase family protein [Actinomycetes bacterium]